MSLSKRVGSRPIEMVVVCVLAASSTRAAASPLFDLTGDTSGMGGLQARGVPGSSAAAYFDPALLTEGASGFDLGFLLLTQQIEVALDGRPGTEFAVPDDISSAGHADFSRFDNYPVPTNDLQFGREPDDLGEGFVARPRQAAGTGRETFAFGCLGLSLKTWQDRLALGLHARIPISEFTRLVAFYVDEREQYFSNSLHPELYGDRLTAPSIAFGVGFRVLEGLSLGVGTTLSLSAGAVAPTYVVDTGDLSKILVDLDTSVDVSLAPHFGLSYLLKDRLRLSATAHAPRRVQFDIDFTFLLANGVEQTSGIHFLLDYSPWQFAAAASFDFVRAGEQTLSVVTSAAYAAWSTYRDRHGQAPGDAYPWADTLSPAVGVRYRYASFSALLDGAYAPSPVPPQTGRTNYVDGDRLSTSVGAELGFPVFGSELHAGLSLQAHRLLPRHQAKLPTPTSDTGANLAPELVKDEVPDDAQVSGEPVDGAEGLQTNNPGWPGFGSEGWLLGAGAYARVTL
jgi:hypothetical protein